MVHATNWGHLRGHPPQYTDANFPEPTGIIINHFLSEKMKNKRILWIIVKNMELDTLLFSPLVSAVLHLCCLDTPLIRVTTLVHFLPFLPPESFERRKMGKNRTKALRIVAFFENLYYHSNCWGICCFSCMVTVQKSYSGSQPPVYGRQQPYVSQNSQDVSLSLCSSLCAFIILYYPAHNRCSKIGFEWLTKQKKDYANQFIVENKNAFGFRNS